MCALLKHRRSWFALIVLILCSCAIAEIHGDAGLPVARAAASAAQAQPAGTSRPGYLLMLEVRDGQTRLQSAAEIDNYVENKHLFSEDDWLLVLYNGRGELIADRRIGNPSRFSPIVDSGQSLPFLAKVPQLSGMAEAVLFDQYLQEQLRIPFNDAFRIGAAANRQAFLAHDRETRRLLLDESGRRGVRTLSAVMPTSSRVPQMKPLSNELQERIQGDMVSEIEQWDQFGLEVMNRRQNVPLEPEQVAHIVGRSPPPGRSPAVDAAVYPASPSFTLSGRVIDLDTGVPLAGAILYFYQYDTSGKFVGFIDRRITDQDGHYSIAVSAGSVYISPTYSGVYGRRYVSKSEYVSISGDTAHDLKAIPGVLLSGAVANAQMQGVGGVAVQAYCANFQLTLSATSSVSGGTYTLTVPANHALRITVSAPVPYVSLPAEEGIVLKEDTIRNFTLETGWIVSGTVTGDGGVPVYRAYVLLRQLATTTTGSPSYYLYTDSNGKFAFALGRNLRPNSFVLAAYASGYVLQSAGLDINADQICDIQLLRGNTVSGTVRDGAGSAVRGARIRAYRGGNLVVSALTTTDGTYDFDLAAGAYEIEAIPPAGGSLAPLTRQGFEVNTPVRLDITLPAADGVLNVKLYFASQGSYQRFATPTLVRFELYRSGLTVYAGKGVAGSGYVEVSQGIFLRPFTQYLPRGEYKLVAFLAGCRPITIENVNVTGQNEISLNVPEPFLWTGTLRGANGTALPKTSILSYTDLAREYELTTTDADGKFSILLTPNGFVKFYTDAGSRNILRTERIGDVTGSRQGDVVLDAFPPFEDSGSPLTQIYGVPDRSSRWNIVMIGDGYTGVNEAYTDVNNNGRWDGVLFYDLNKNSVWDSGEPFQRYGTASAPVAGKNPTLNNEPFTDLNGDGAPNLNDQELFSQNTLDTARSLFGQDEWKFHREAFNIYRIRLVSRQAGHKVMDSDGNVVVDRDTALGTYLNTPERSYLFSANYTIISQYINEYVPECDTRIVLVNQPIRMGRVNSYMFQYGGDVPTLSSDYTVAHEMGHNVGLLADEYTEYQATYRGAESAARNVTLLTDKRYIPWRYLIPAGKEIPSVPGSSGIGLFEGGRYYTGGIYRPTEYCMMVSGNRYCPICTAEIETRLRDITGVIPDLKLSGMTIRKQTLYPQFSWEPPPGASHYQLEVEKAGSHELIASYDIYDISFTLPFALVNSADYRWRLRPASPSRWGSWSSWIDFRAVQEAFVFTGMFAQIAAGGGFQTWLTVMNPGTSDADAEVSMLDSRGAPFNPQSADPVPLNIKPAGTKRLEIALPGNGSSGYARIKADQELHGSALFRAMKDGLVLSEAGVGLSRPARDFAIYIDNLGNARTGYAVANSGALPANLNLTLRDRFGTIREQKSVTLPPGEHLSEFAFQRFPLTAPDGFEGSLAFSSDQEVAAVAVRFDNVELPPESQVFSTVPILTGDAATTLYFPQVAEGGGYRTNLILVNPSTVTALVTIEFYRDDGTSQGFAVNGVSRTRIDWTLNPGEAAHLFTDGSQPDVLTGWARVTSTAPVFGSSIFQTRSGSRILSEAGVSSSPGAPHFMAYMESLGSAESGLAICNPNAQGVTLTLNLRTSSGLVAATDTLELPAHGHIARFFGEWFPHSFGEFEGSLEVIATAPVSAVAIRYDNPQMNVFATLPVVVLK